MGITELKWIGIGHIQSDHHTVCCSEHEKRRRDALVFIVMKSVQRQYFGTMQLNRFHEQLSNMRVILILAQLLMQKKLTNFMVKFYLKLTEHAAYD